MLLAVVGCFANVAESKQERQPSLPSQRPSRRLCRLKQVPSPRGLRRSSRLESPSLSCLLNLREHPRLLLLILAQPKLPSQQDGGPAYLTPAPSEHADRRPSRRDPGTASADKCLLRRGRPVEARSDVVVEELQARHAAESPRGEGYISPLLLRAP